MPGEARQSDGMPPEIERIFAAVWQDVGNLDVNWTAVRQLFGTSPERIKLLMRYGRMFWSQVQQALYRDVLLRICHLTDNATMRNGQFKNRSIHRLLSEIERHDASLLGTLGLQVKYDQLVRHCSKIRDLRNRALAHRDWDTDVNPLPSTDMNEVDDAIAEIIDIMDTVEFHFSHHTTYHGFKDRPGDAAYLVRCLEKLARLEEKEWREKGLPGGPWALGSPPGPA